MSRRKVGDFYVEQALAARFDPDNRRIFVSGPIDRKRFDRLAIAITMLQHVGGDAGIEIVLNSLGGSLRHGLAMHDLIAACPRDVTITVVGEACSAASIILQGADNRVLSRNSMVMIHDGWAVLGGTPGEVETQRQQWATQRDLMHRIFADRANLPLARIKRLCRSDTWLTATQAVELGLADRLL